MYLEGCRKRFDIKLDSFSLTYQSYCKILNFKIQTLKEKQKYALKNLTFN